MARGETKTFAQAKQGLVTWLQKRSPDARKLALEALAGDVRRMGAKPTRKVQGKRASVSLPPLPAALKAQAKKSHKKKAKVQAAKALQPAGENSDPTS